MNYVIILSISFFQSENKDKDELEYGKYTLNLFASFYFTLLQ